MLVAAALELLPELLDAREARGRVLGFRRFSRTPTSVHYALNRRIDEVAA